MRNYLLQRKERASKHKGCSHLFKVGQGEEIDEEIRVMAAMCHNGGIFNAIQLYRENEEYYKQVNQLRAGTK